MSVLQYVINEMCQHYNDNVTVDARCNARRTGSLSASFGDDLTANPYVADSAQYHAWRNGWYDRHDRDDAIIEAKTRY